MKPLLPLALVVALPLEAATLEGSAEFVSAFGYKAHAWQKAQWQLSPRLDLPITESVNATVLARLRHDHADQLAPGQAYQGARSHSNRRYQPNDHTDAELREVYLDASVAGHYLRLGKQQVVWGQADGIRILDLLNPMDYHEFILPEVADRRIPLWMLNLESPFAHGTLQTLLIVDPTFEQMSEQGAAFAFGAKSYVPALPEHGRVRVNPHQRPSQTLNNADVGLRYAGFVGGWDFSLNYLYHYQDQALYALQEHTGWAELTPYYARSHLLGASASNAFGAIALRAEVGYLTDKYLVTEGPSRVGQSPEIAWVVGLDYTGLSRTFISVQAYQAHLLDAPARTVRNTHERQLSVLLRHQLLNEALALEAFVLQNARHREGLVQLKARYQLSSQWAVRAGVDHFYGARTGLFGQFGEASRLSLGASYAF